MQECLALAKVILVICNECQNNEIEIKYAIKSIAALIYILPENPSGLASIEAANLLVEKCTKEHFFSRTMTAKKILELFNKNIINENRLSRLALFLKSRSRTHYVTKEQNRVLSKIQNSDQYPTWREQYAAAGIRLVPKAFLKTQCEKTVYMIDGKVFRGKQDTARHFGINPKTLYRRVISKNENWRDWQYYTGD